MASLPPKIDRRSYEKIVTQTKDLVQQYTAWQPASEGKVDSGEALIRIFARMVKSVSDRLNQVPEKNFLAFLDLIGGELKPPQPAKVPLTFYLAEGSSVDAVVPAHTQVSAPAADTDTEIIFESDRELIVTTSQLQAVYVREPGRDRYSDRTLAATGQKDEAFLAFEGDRPLPHFLYIACPEIFALPKINNFKLTFSGETEKIESIKEKLEWFNWDGLQWNLLTEPPTYDGNKFTFANLPLLKATEIEGKTAKWLQVNLTGIDSDLAANLPKISGIQGSISITQSDLIPEACLYNNAPLDLSKDFLPFGDRSQLNDTFYIALHDAYIKPNVTIELKLDLSHKPSTTSDLEIVWELNDGQTWQAITNSSDRLKQTKNSAIQFTESDNITATFKISDRNIPSASTVNGETRYWIRARIIKGHFGEAQEELKYPVFSDLAVVTAEVGKNNKKIKVDSLDLFKKGDKVRLFPNTGFPEEHEITNISPVNQQLTIDTGILNNSLAVGTRIQRKSIVTETIPPTYDPPIIKSLKLTYQGELKEDAVCIADNDFNFSHSNNDFQPFVTTKDKQPTLYLGFDRPFSNKTITLYAQVEPPSPEELSQDPATTTTKPELVWEYSSASGWQPLGVRDETQAFSQRGLIQFIAPVDLSQRKVFNRELCWLRVRWVAGNFRVKPRLCRLMTNTVWAIQAVSLKDEILGSSSEDTNQIFFANNIPILQGQQLEIQEGQIPSDIESDRVSIVRDELNEIESVWVQWQEVADFYSSGKSDRHYVLDRYTGKITFGDGITGMIPPRGQNNLRLSFYRMGGGKQGNVSKETVAQLKTTIPYIDRAINHEAAAGGTEQESLEQLKIRVPKQLRHRDRAVTVEDLEDLAYEASTDVARVKVVTPDLNTADFSPFNQNFWLDPSQPNISFEAAYQERLNKIPQGKQQRQIIEDINRRAGRVKLIVLPNSSDRQPVPSLALLERVKSYILTRCEPNINLVVTVPKWKRVKIETTIVPTSLENAELLINKVKQALEIFLHPLTGGKYKKGWEFGRRPYGSDFYAIIQSIAGVAWVDSLTVWVNSEIVFSSTETLDSKLSLMADELIYAGDFVVNLLNEANR